MKIKLFTVVCLIGELPMIRYGTFKTKREAVDYVWHGYNLFSHAEDALKEDVRLSLDIYANTDQEDMEEWNPWYSGGDQPSTAFRMSIKPIHVDTENNSISSPGSP